MSRIRTVKPELSKHEGMFDAEKETGLPLRFAWAMLPTACDRDGRFDWKPRTLKADLLPHDELDFSRVLDAWLTRGQIVKYRVGHEWFGMVPTWRKHQIVNNRENPSDIPSIDEADEVIDHTKQPLPNASSTREARENDATATESQSRKAEGKGRERKGKEKEKISGSLGGDPPDDRVPYQAIVDLFNGLLTKLPKVRELTPKRKTLVRAAWCTGEHRRSLEFWRCYLEECADDAFLNGTGPYTNGHENWRPSFDYLLRPEVVTRTYERAMDRLERSSPRQISAGVPAHA